MALSGSFASTRYPRTTSARSCSNSIPASKTRLPSSLRPVSEESKPCSRTRKPADAGRRGDGRRVAGNPNGDLWFACGRLVRENNEEHQLANRWPAISEPALLDAAGRLCACNSSPAERICPVRRRGRFGIPRTPTSPRRRSGDATPCTEDRTVRVSRRRLHGSGPPAGRRIPRRKIPGEADRRERVAGRTSPRLMTGHDGVVVSELRGLSAWLAAHCKTSRKAIIERDPLDTVLYGDARGFSPDEKRHLLDCLRRETKRNPWFAGFIPRDPRLGDVATPDMADFFRQILSDPARDDARQSFVLILLRSLEHGGVIPELADLLVDVVRDSRWWPGLRRTALDTFIQHRNGAASELTALLMDINDGSVSDPYDDLLGSLLSALYPTYLSTPEVLRYLKMPQSSSYLGLYCYFWIRRLPEKSSPSQLAELLDAVVERFDELRPLLAGDRQQPACLYLGRIPLILAARFLETSQEAVSTERLFDWLGAVSSCCNNLRMQEENIIRDWLNSPHRRTKRDHQVGYRKSLQGICFQHHVARSSVSCRVATRLRILVSGSSEDGCGPPSSGVFHQLGCGFPCVTVATTKDFPKSSRGTHCR